MKVPIRKPASVLVSWPLGLFAHIEIPELIHLSEEVSYDFGVAFFEC